MSSYFYYCKSEEKLHYEQLIFTGENVAFFFSEEERFSGEILIETIRIISKTAPCHKLNYSLDYSVRYGACFDLGQTSRTACG